MVNISKMFAAVLGSVVIYVTVEGWARKNPCPPINNV